MIHEIQDGTFVISSHRCWMPGCYESRKAAQFAFRFCDDLLCKLRDEAIETNNGVITYEAMKKMQAERGLSCGQGAHAPGWKEGDPIVFTDGRSTP